MDVQKNRKEPRKEPIPEPITKHITENKMHSSSSSSKPYKCKIIIDGYFVDYDQWNRAKLMFLDDYDNLNNLSFTKSFMIKKSESHIGKNPIVDNNKYMLINCKNDDLGYLPDNDENKTKIKVLPITELLQHKVRCYVSINDYNFKKNNLIISGWNIKLIKMSLLEY
jgi:hypothetical protein